MSREILSFILYYYKTLLGDFLSCRSELIKRPWEFALDFVENISSKDISEKTIFYLKWLKHAEETMVQKSI